MKCADAQRWISNSLDEDLTAKRARKLNDHLEACPDCRALAHDFAEIVRQARNLKSPEPSPSVWPRVAAAVRESLEEEPAPGLRRTGGWGAWRPINRWRFVAASALALVIVGALVFRQVTWRARVSPEEGSVEYTLAKLQEAQSYYEKAIRSLSEAAKSRDSSLNPQLVEIFARNLAAMDETIQTCRQIVERDPANLTARAFLLTAYREKVDVLEEMVGLERSAVPGKTETAL